MKAPGASFVSGRRQGAQLDRLEAASGKTGGSRRRFVHPTAPVLALHKPHPGNIVKMYVVREVVRVLTEEGLI